MSFRSSALALMALLVLPTILVATPSAKACIGDELMTMRLFFDCSVNERGGGLGGYVAEQCQELVIWTFDDHWREIDGPWRFATGMSMFGTCEEVGDSISEIESRARGEDGNYRGQHAEVQEDADQNLMGDAFEVVYWMSRESTRLQRLLGDMDNDGLSNYLEFKWGTIPVLSTQLTVEGSRASLSIGWARDTDWDGLGDLQEYRYWNFFPPPESNPVLLQPELYEEAAALSFDSAAVRDGDSMRDFDSDSCTSSTPAIEGFFAAGTPRPSGSIDLDTRVLTHCSHLADDWDSDNDGLSDGAEATDRTGIGLRRAVCAGETCSPRWIGGAFPWAVDSDCQLDHIEIGGFTYFCHDTGNYHNNTGPHLARVAQLNPGAGDGLPDAAERSWWIELASSPRYVEDVKMHAVAWSTSAQTAQDGIPRDLDGPLQPYEVDYDGDSSPPLMDRDSDNDGYTDYQEYLTWPGRFDPNVANVCPGGKLLPYLNDTDLDGLLDAEECHGSTQPWNWDSDGDGMPDGWELRHALSPDDPADASQNADADRQELPVPYDLTNLEEYCYRPPARDVSASDRAWGCTDANGDGIKEYYGWNPCALDPTKADTDNDTLADVDEARGGTNAAGPEPAECPLKTRNADDAPPTPPRLPGPPPTGEPDVDISEHLQTLLDDLYSRSERVEEEILSPTETAQEQLDALVDAANATAEAFGEMLNSTASVNITELSEATFETLQGRVAQATTALTGNLSPVLAPVTQLASALDAGVPTVDDALDLLPFAPVLDEVRSTQRETLESATTILSDPASFVETTLGAVEAAVAEHAPLPPKPDPLAGLPPLDPSFVLESESVVPDFFFNLAKATLPDGSTAWDAYSRSGDPDQAFYKVLVARPGHEPQISENTLIGSAFAWNVDGDITTGANAACSPPLCATSHNVGDDLHLGLAAAPGTIGDPFLKPRVTITKLDPTEYTPWLVLAYAIPRPHNQLLNQPGYVAYVGVDARPTSAAPAGAADGYAGDRSYLIDDLPTMTTFDLLDYGILSTPEEGGVDPDNKLGVAIAVEPSPGRSTDARVAGGLAEYEIAQVDASMVKRLKPDGNATDLSILFRGAPSTATLSYALARSEPTATSAARTDQLDLAWTASFAPSTPSRGFEAAINRVSNHDGARAASAVAATFSTMTSTRLHGTTVTVGSARSDNFLYEADRRLAEAYVSVERWDNLADPAAKTGATRLGLRDIAPRIVVAADTTTRNASILATEGIGQIRLLTGENDSSCQAAATTAANVVAYTQPSEDGSKKGCLLLVLQRIRELSIDLPEPAPDAVAALSLILDRVAETSPTADSASVWLDAGDAWTAMRLTDLPESGRMWLNRTPATKAIELDYHFLPEDAMPDLRLDARFPDAASRDGRSRLNVTIETLPSAAQIAIIPHSDLATVAFTSPAGRLQTFYSQSDEAPSFAGSHVAMSVRDGRESFSIDLEGFKEATIDASRPREFRATGDITDARGTTIHIERAAPTGQRHDDAFQIQLSSLPGTFEIDWRQPDPTTALVKTRLATPIASIHVRGILRDRYYDLDLVGLEDLDLRHVDSPTAPRFSLTANTPVTVSGVAHDLDSDARPPAAPPAWAEDHFIHQTFPDGSRTLSFHFTGIERLEISRDRNVTSATGGASDALRIVGSFVTPSPSDFMGLIETTFDDAPPQRLYAEVQPLPASIKWQLRGSSTTLDTSSPIDHVAIEMSDPTAGRSVWLDATSIPTHLEASWPTSAIAAPVVDIRHDGSTFPTVDLVYSNSTSPMFIKAYAKDIPDHVHAEWSRAERTLRAYAMNDGALTMTGAIDIQLATTSDVGLTPVDDELWREYVHVDATPSSERYIARLTGLKSVDAHFGQGLAFEGAIHLEKASAASLKAHYISDRMDLVAELRDAPAQLDLEFAGDETTEEFHLGWDGNTHIGSASVDAALKTKSARLYAVLGGVLDLTANLTTDGFTLDTHGTPIDLELEYGPDAQDVPISQPSRDEIDFVLWDNATLQREEHERTPGPDYIVRVDIVGLEHAVLDSPAGVLNLTLDGTRSARPLEAVALDVGLRAHVNASALPTRLDLDLHRDDEREGRLLTVNASAGTDELEVDALVSSPHTTNDEVYEIAVHATSLPPELAIAWDQAGASLSTRGRGAIGTLELLAVNRTSPREDSVAQQLAGNGVLYVRDPRYASAETTAFTGLHQIFARLTDVEEVAASRPSPTAIDFNYSRDARTGAEGVVLIATEDAFVKLTLDDMPQSITRGRADFAKTVTETDLIVDATLDLVSSSGIGSGSVLIRTYVPRAEAYEMASEWSWIMQDVPSSVSLVVKRHHVPVEGTTLGADHMWMNASADGADILQVRLWDDDATVAGQIVDLPAQLALRLTPDKRDGTLDAGQGSIGAIDLTSRAGEPGSYHKFENVDGLVAGASRTGDFTWIGFTDLQYADWYIPPGGIEAGSGDITLHHTSSGWKPVRVAIVTPPASQDLNGDGVESPEEQEFLSVGINDLPGQWNMTFRRVAASLELHYDANESLPWLWANWHRGVDADHGNEWWHFEAQGLPAGAQHLTAVLDHDIELHYASAAGADAIAASGKVRDGYFDVELTGPGTSLDFTSKNEFRRGSFHGVADHLDAFYGRCPAKDSEDRCAEYPLRPTSSNFLNADNVVYADNLAALVYLQLVKPRTAEWSLDEGAREDWKRIHYRHEGGATDLRAEVLHVGQAAEEDLTLDVQDLAPSVEVIFHAPFEAAGRADEGLTFQTPGASSVDNRDIFLQSIVEAGDAPMRVRLDVVNPARSVLVEAMEGLESGILHLRGSSAGEPIRGYSGTLAFPTTPALNVIFQQRLPTADLEPMYLDIWMREPPTTMNIDAYRSRSWSETCEVFAPTPGCEAEFGIILPTGEEVGLLELTLNLRSSSAERVKPSIQLPASFPPSVRSSATNAIVLETGASLRANMTLRNVGSLHMSMAPVRADAAATTFTADLDSQNNADIIWLTKVPEGDNERHAYMTARLRDFDGQSTYRVEYAKPADDYEYFDHELDMPAGSGDIAVAGNIPLQLFGHTSKEFWSVAEGVQGRSRVTMDSLSSAAPGIYGRGIWIETPGMDALRSSVSLIRPEPEDRDTSLAKPAETCSWKDDTMIVQLNEGSVQGAIGLLEARIATPDGLHRASGYPNHFVLAGSTATDDRFGLHARLEKATRGTFLMGGPQFDQCGRFDAALHLAPTQGTRRFEARIDTAIPMRISTETLPDDVAFRYVPGERTFLGTAFGAAGHGGQLATCSDRAGGGTSARCFHVRGAFSFGGCTWTVGLSIGEDSRVAGTDPLSAIETRTVIRQLGSQIGKIAFEGTERIYTALQVAACAGSHTHRFIGDVTDRSITSCDLSYDIDGVGQVEAVGLFSLHCGMRAKATHTAGQGNFVLDTRSPGFMRSFLAWLEKVMETDEEGNEKEVTYVRGAGEQGHCSVLPYAYLRKAARYVLIAGNLWGCG